MKHYFAAEGLLAKVIPYFKPRRSQELMAQAVKKTITQKQVLVVEAETGTGKTFAYLLPALRAKKKVIISTGSKTLQDQLLSKDLPLVTKALAFSGTVALLKGRANYLCLERLTKQIYAGGDLTDPLKVDLANVHSWSSQTEDGDVSKCVTVMEDSPIWPMITSTNDNCLGADCPDYANCFVVKARRRAMAADVVVVNHHLYFADAVVKKSGFGELIPKGEVMIFDEAHQLADVASLYFGEQLSSRQLFDLAKQIIILYRTEIKEVAQLQKSAESLHKAVQDLLLALNLSDFRGNLRDIIKTSDVQRALRFLHDSLQFCAEVLAMVNVRSASVKTALERLQEYQALFSSLCETDIKGWSFWYEVSPYHFVMGKTPLSIENQFQQMMNRQEGSWIFTSATLSIDGKLTYFTDRLGIHDATFLQLQSPFEYEKQTLLCVPRYLPQLTDPHFAAKIADLLLPVIQANQGRCFFLCTSIKMMKELTELFRQQFTLPVLMQGESSKTKLIERFTQEGNALLVATNSFWEGVDIRGDVLSCVIIDKLPFSSPDDPLIKARIEDLQLQGKDPFFALQIPEAVIALKQGVGRLIRDEEDSGVVIICDNRLVTRAYGEIFINSLPAFPRTRDLGKVLHFFAKNKKNNEENSEAATC